MPAEVSMPMNEVLARLEGVLRTNAPQVLATLQPGLSEQAIAKLEKDFGVNLPDDIKELYQWHNGSRPATNVLEEFLPLYRYVPLDEALTERKTIQQQAQSANLIGRVGGNLFAGHRDSWICLFDDGAGNGYFYDPKRKPAEGSVFYNYMDEADYTFFPCTKNVLAGVAACYEHGAFSVKASQGSYELDEDYEAAAKIWSEFGVSR
jgi:cell wall assembly regulator SMI1